MKYSNNWLKDKQDIQFLFFWGHRRSADGSITKSCFSQWWEAPFVIEGRTYFTAEHWMMASKASLFGDMEIMEKILETPSPANVKKLGRKVKNFDPAIWEKHKYSIVVTGNVQKFAQHPALKSFLLNTGDKVLVEASPMDAIWGIGMSVEHPTVNDPSSWRGENLLGYALMEARDQLAA
jgi:ribA/ribD-fused uncharacterized protein